MRRIKISVYMFSALIAGIAGVLMAGWLGGVTHNLGEGVELSVIAATVIGGANLMGGSGTALGGVVGAALIEVIRNSLTLLGISTFWQGTFIGSCILIAVMLHCVRGLPRDRGLTGEPAWPSPSKKRSGKSRHFAAAEEIGSRILRGDFAPGRPAAQRGRVVQAAAHEPVGRARGHQDAEGQGAAALAAQGRHARRAARALEPARSRRAAPGTWRRPSAARFLKSVQQMRRIFEPEAAALAAVNRDAAQMAAISDGLPRHGDGDRPSRAASRRTCASIWES